MRGRRREGRGREMREEEKKTATFFFSGPAASGSLPLSVRPRARQTDAGTPPFARGTRRAQSQTPLSPLPRTHFGLAIPADRVPEGHLVGVGAQDLLHLGVVEAQFDQCLFVGDTGLEFLGLCECQILLNLEDAVAGADAEP